MLDETNETAGERSCPRTATETQRLPSWLRVKTGKAGQSRATRELVASHGLRTVCEGARCPNIGECFGHGTATFMIMGDKCTRRCPFCDVGHGRPDPLDANEPANLAKTIAQLKLKYVVVTSVDLSLIHISEPPRPS